MLCFYKFKPELNPAITFTNFILGKNIISENFIKILIQIAGAILSGILLLVIFGQDFRKSIASPNLMFNSITDLGNDYLIIIEFTSSFIVMFFYIFSFRYKKNKTYIFALTIFLFALFFSKSQVLVLTF